MRGRAGAAVYAAGLVLALAPGWGLAQTLRYSNHREVQPPDYALIRIGPFYSNVEFSQSAGWRYTRSRGTGTDYLVDNRLGAIQDDSTEFPLVSVFTMRNYLMLSRRADLDLSVSAMYAYYPRDTQKSGWQVFFPEEGVSAGLSSDFTITPFVRGMIYDNMLYRTDFVDTRGLNDYYGGEEYEYFNNVAGLNMDWLMAKDQNMGLSFSREDMVPRDDEFEDQRRTTYSESAIYQYELFLGLVFGAGASFVQHRYAVTGRVDVAQQNYFVNLGFARDAVGVFRLTRATTGSVKVGYSRAAGATRSRVSDDAGQDTAASGRSQAEAMFLDARLDTDVSEEVTQTISFGKGLRNGFEAPIERYEGWSYRLAWQRDQASAAVWTGFAAVDPQGGLSSRYDDWSSGANLTVPLGKGAAAVATTTYADRLNRDKATQGPRPEPTDDEYAGWLQSTSDYATWTSTVGVRVPVTRRINFSADASHIERISREKDLAYTRDVLAATLTYTRQF